MDTIREIDLTGSGSLSPETILWRYVPLRTLFLYLSNRVFIPSISTLRNGDPFEARFYYDDHPADFNGAMDERYGKDASSIYEWLYNSRFAEWEKKSVLDTATQKKNYDSNSFPAHYFEFVRQTRYAWCWFNPPTSSESAAMWNIYGKDGVAVATTIEGIVAALKKTNRDFEYGRLHYLDVGDHGWANPKQSLSPREFSHDQAILRPHFLKRAEYQSENEVRFVTAEAQRGDGGVILTLNASDWIKKIKFWPGLSPSEADALKESIHTKFPTIECKRSNLLRDASQESAAERAAYYFETTWHSSGDSDYRIPTELKRLLPTNSDQ